ncbi:hypothetical protein ACHAPU_004774 [Fusarium lateritium]
MDTTTPNDNVESPDTATVPTKPSLRILDGSMNLTTRDDDLTYGPLLLGLGQGHSGEPDVSGLDEDLASQESHLYHTNESALPSSPSRIHESHSVQAVVESEPSESGPLISVPTTSTYCETVAYPGPEMSLPPLPRHFEFSWKDSNLCLAGEPLNVIKALGNPYSEANPASEVAFSTSKALLSDPQVHLSGTDDHDSLDVAGIGGFYGSADSWSSVTFPRDLELAFMGASASSTSSEPDPTMEDNLHEQVSNPMLHIAMEKTVEWIVDLLIDDFFRSYAPQQKRKRTAAAGSENTSDTPTTQDGVAQSSNKRSKVRRETYRRKKIDNNEESEDEEPSLSSGAKSKDTLYFACPFIKWRPAYYGNCTRRHMFSRQVKRHLNKDHKQACCPTCFKIFADEFVPMHSCVEDLPLPDHIITEEMSHQLKRPKSMHLTEEEEWHRIYKILFPNAPPCLDPYISEATAKSQDTAERYVRHPERQALIRREIRNAGLEPPISDRVFKLFCYRILPMLGESCGLDEYETAHEEEHIIGLPRTKLDRI